MTEGDPLRSLIQQWRNVKEIRDFGSLGSVFPQDGYNAEGFRLLKATEKRLLSLCADQLAAVLDALPNCSDQKEGAERAEHTNPEASSHPHRTHE